MVVVAVGILVPATSRIGGSGRIRTDDQEIKSLLLYQLSYGPAIRT